MKYEHSSLDSGWSRYAVSSAYIQSKEGKKTVTSGKMGFPAGRGWGGDCRIIRQKVVVVWADSINNCSADL